MTRSELAMDVPVPPPLLYFGLLVVGVAIGYFIPIAFLPSIVALLIGVPLTIAGFFLMVYSFRALVRAKTPPDFRPVTALVTEGPYRYTRNPIYVSFSLICAGLGVAFDSVAALLLLLVAIVFIDRAIIRREERYLQQKFGEEYLRYKARVRRWI